MEFTNAEPEISSRDIVDIEAMLGMNFPQPVRELYLSSNGGIPHLYVFEDDNVDTVVAAFLPLTARDKGTALRSYKHLVLEKEIIPRQFFPFAVDGGGDYFFVDCWTPDGAVYFYRSDSADGEGLIDLKLNFDQFWSSLRAE